jgi:hypothetical protein
MLHGVAQLFKVGFAHDIKGGFAGGHGDGLSKMG